MKPRSFSAALAEPIEAVAAFDRHQVDKVARLGSSEQGEELVDRQLLATEHGGWPPGLGREESRVGGQVDLGAIVRAFDDQTSEAGVLLNVMDGEARLS